MRSRSALVCVVALAGALLATGCGSAEPMRASGISDFRNGFVELRHPTAWAAVQPDVTEELHVHPLLYLSMQPTRNPCVPKAAEVVCGWPVSSLRRGGVLIVVENRGYPGWTLDSMPGSATRIGGRPARTAVSRPGPCAEIGADETVQVAIARPLSGNWTAVTACLRAPNLVANTRSLDAVLASMRFKTP